MPLPLILVYDVTYRDGPLKPRPESMNASIIQSGTEACSTTITTAPLHQWGKSVRCRQYRIEHKSRLCTSASLLFCKDLLPAVKSQDQSQPTWNTY